MFIEDEELRTLYRDASKEHLDNLETGFLYLEKHPNDTAKLKELLRATHSLKGDSRMLGVKDAETLTHQVETLLSDVEQGDRQLTSTLWDNLYQGLDAIRKIAHAAVTGEPVNINVFQVIAQLMSVGNTFIDDSDANFLEENNVSPPIISLEEGSPLLEESLTRISAQDNALADINLTILEELEAELETSYNNDQTKPDIEPSITPDLAGIADDTNLTILEELAAELETSYDNSQIKPDTELSPTTSSINAQKEKDLVDNNLALLEGLASKLDAIDANTQANSDLELSDTSVSPPNADFHGAERVETVRVETAKLDTLVNQASELSITKRSITNRVDDINKILLVLEACVRENIANRPTFNDAGIQQYADTSTPLQSPQQTTQEPLTQLGELLQQLRSSAYEDALQLETLAYELESGILKLRQLPLSNLFNLFPRMVRDLSKQQGKTISLVIEGGDIQVDKLILEEMKDPLNHLIRNAIDHGIEAPIKRTATGKPPAATIWLKAYQNGNQIVIEVVDDGRGLNLDSIKETAIRRGLFTEKNLAKMSIGQLQDLIFAPGFSTRTTVTEISGRGVGLDIVRTNVERLKGSIQVDSKQTQGCTFRFTLSTSLAKASVLIVSVDQTTYGIPIEFVDTMIRVNRQDISVVKGLPAIDFQGNSLSVAWLADLLALPVSVREQTQPLNTDQFSIPCIVIKVGSQRLGLFVDALVDQQEIVLKSYSKLLKRVRNIAGATILGTGKVCMILNPQDLLKSVEINKTGVTAANWETLASKPKILLVEDSLPIRTQVRRILEGAGYQVITAVDGLDGFNKLQQENKWDAVVSDVEMPNRNGLELTACIRKEAKYKELPIILVTTLAREEDKRRGAAAGANAYITKGDFDQSLLISALRRLI